MYWLARQITSLKCAANHIQLATPGNFQSVYTTDALAEIWFISDLTPHIQEAWIQSDNNWFHILFFCLHVHVTDQICATWEEKIGPGSLEPCSVNPDLDKMDLMPFWRVIYKVVFLTFCFLCQFGGSGTEQYLRHPSSSVHYSQPIDFLNNNNLKNRIEWNLKLRWKKLNLTH